MSEVKRYLPTAPMVCMMNNRLVVQGIPSSAFVLASEYDAPAAECERLRSERDAFRDSRNYLIEEISSHLSEIAELRDALLANKGEKA